jgi:hypothetical protein
MSRRVFGYTFGRVPTWLLDTAVSDRAIRLFALLTRYADRDGRGFPGRRVLAQRLGREAREGWQTRGQAPRPAPAAENTEPPVEARRAEAASALSPIPACQPFNR